jgi:hypothetical protein
MSNIKHDTQSAPASSARIDGVDPDISHQSGSAAPADDGQPALPKIQVTAPITRENTSWAVTERGLESKRVVDYVIERERIVRPQYGDDNFAWLMQMADKSWVNIEEVIEAYRWALQHHAPQQDTSALPAMEARARERSSHMKKPSRAKKDGLGHNYFEDAEERFEAYRRRPDKP